jgi:hypothetical protein
MKTTRIALVAILLLECLILTAEDVRAGRGSQEQRSEVAGPSPDFNPPHIFPLKDQYVITEGETVVITLNVIYPALSGGCIETPHWELAAASPGFAMLSGTFGRSFKLTGNDNPFVHQMALLILSPQKGDAGKYNITVLERLCPGPPEAGTMLPFRIKVKRG